MTAPFQELETKNLKGSTIFLDVDGTLVADGQESVNQEMISKIDEIKTDNTVYLCSNKPGMTERNRKLAEMLGVQNVCSPYNKPSKKVLNGLPESGRRSVVVGDKFLTDGLFAKNIRAEFVKVKRIKTPSDSWMIALIYMVDDLFYRAYLYFRLMRPWQWIKNVFIFVPLFFAKELFTAEKFVTTLFAFFAFCLLASAVYVINDITDRRQDAAHPSKSKRPLASGEISLVEALGIFFILLSLGAILTVWFAPKAAPALMVYLLLNLLYSFYLKLIVIFDIVAISAFYLLRILVGGLATDTFISRWLVLCVIFLALFIIIGKRKSEFGRAHADKREVLRFYSAGLLDHLQTISAALAIVSYGLYSVLGVSSSLAVYSTLLVVLGIYRYLYIVNSSGEAEYPEKLVLKDKVILGSFIGWVGFMYYIFYV